MQPFMFNLLNVVKMIDLGKSSIDASFYFYMKSEKNSKARMIFGRVFLLAQVSHYNYFLCSDCSLENRRVNWTENCNNLTVLYPPI